MKIGIIGGSEGLGAVIAAELAKRYLPDEVEVVVVECAQDIAVAEDLAYLDLLFDPRFDRPEPVVMPLVIRPMEPWPESFSPSRARYNRTPKWKRNESGSKFF
jgi:hypothetical protein